jgi:hypothetical protein
MEGSWAIVLGRLQAGVARASDPDLPMAPRPARLKRRGVLSLTPRPARTARTASVTCS